MKRINSALLAAAMAVSAAPVFAEYEDLDADIASLLEEEGITGSMSEHEPLHPVYMDIKDENEDADKTELLDSDNESDTSEEQPDRSINYAEVWDSVFANEFGDAYNKPFEYNNSAANVVGDSNRLVIEETDLHLAGKNGLDLDLKRAYDNQDSNEMYLPTSTNTSYSTSLKIYSYRNTSTNENINIAFLCEDHMYLYMPNEFCVSQINTVYRQRKSYGGGYIYFYHFKDIYRYKANTGIVLQRNVNTAPVSIQISDISLGLINYSMFCSSNALEDGWKFIMPEASLHVQTYGYNNSAHTSMSREFVGAFKDIHGNVSFINASDIIYYNNLSSSHLSTAYNDKGKIIDYSLYYDGTSTFENTGVKYNFTASDPEGYTYYFYCDDFEQATLNQTPGQNFYMSIIAVEDNYGNYIRYSYDTQAKTGPITGIIDTYGREIDITRTSSGCTVGYEDEDGIARVITYAYETLPANTLNNNSLIGHRAVELFSVTNQLGETTEYYSRP
ncbi:MAG: hypothetical protein IJH94_07450, partial [Clostridia bacterium]|nr:hypothetical protein [Clostridia bacterium]